MNYKIKKLPKSKIEIEVTISSKDMDSFFAQAKKEAVVGAKIKGFRPGKAPLSMAASEGEIYDLAAHLAINKTYPEIIEKEKLEVLGSAKADILKIAPQNDFQYKITVAVFPELDLADYKKISKEILKTKKEVRVEEEEKKKSLEWLQKSRAKTISVSRPAQKGDFVELDIFYLEGAENLNKGKPERQSFVLGEEKIFLPEFEENIIGLKSGEEKEITLEIPENQQDKNLAGKKVKIKIDIKNVSEKRLPEASDEWAKTLGDFENLKALEKSLEEGIFQEKEMKEKGRLRAGMMEEIAKETKGEIPEEFALAEVENRIHDLKHLAEDYGLLFEDYLKKMKKSEEDLRKEFFPEAEKGVKEQLVLREIARKEKISPSIEEIKKEVMSFIKRYPRDAFGEEKKENLAAFFKEKLANEKVFEFLENLD